MKTLEFTINFRVEPWRGLRAWKATPHGNHYKATVIDDTLVLESDNQRDLAVFSKGSYRATAVISHQCVVTEEYGRLHVWQRQAPGLWLSQPQPENFIHDTCLAIDPSLQFVLAEIGVDHRIVKWNVRGMVNRTVSRCERPSGSIHDMNERLIRQIFSYVGHDPYKLVNRKWTRYFIPNYDQTVRYHLRCVWARARQSIRNYGLQFLGITDILLIHGMLKLVLKR